MSEHKQMSEYEMKSKQTIEQYGRDKCLDVYEMSAEHIPLKAGQKYSTWQEQVAAELNISENESMDLWAAGNYILQEERLTDSKDVISKFGEETCKKIHAEMMTIMSSDPDWKETISKKYSIEHSEVFNIFLAGANISMKESAASSLEAMKQYHNSKHKLPSCPKTGCNGKLHVGVSLSKETDGLYFCDMCNATFRKK